MTSIPLGERQSIDIGAVEKDLAALWKQPVGEGAQRAQVTRSCVMTLIAVVSGQREANEVTSAIIQMTDRFPNRTIVIDAQPESGGESLEAWAQVSCQVPAAGSTQICCEQIAIEARGAGVGRVPGAVLPLLVPDVPVVVWWPRSAPLGTPLFERLNAMADRVIIDSALIDEPEGQIGGLLAKFGKGRAISDLAWGRLTPWRELTAQFFDTPSAVSHLSEITDVAVRYRARPDGTVDRLQPLLFIGWLASKLGWRTAECAECNRDTSMKLQRPDGGMVKVSLAAIPGDLRHDEQIEGVVMHCDHASYQISREGERADGVIVATREGELAPLRRVVHLEQVDLLKLLAEELRQFGRDLGYEQALGAAAAMVA